MEAGIALQITPALKEKLDRIVAQGTYADSGEALEAAIGLLEERERKLAWLRKELAIGEEQEKRGELIEFTRERMDQLMKEATERSRLGVPVKDAVKP